MALRRVKPEEAKRMMDEEGFVYLDVRSVPEFEQGHPTGAYNVPLMHMSSVGMQSNADFMDVVTRAFAKDTKIVVGCKSGGRSLRAAESMLAAGFTTVVDQLAGFSGAADAFGRVAEPGWLAKGLGTSTTAESGRSWAELSGAAVETKARG